MLRERLRELPYQLHHQNLPGTLLTKASWSFHTGMVCSPLTQTLQLFFLLPFAANSHLADFCCSASHLVFFLVTSSWLDTVLWLILEFLLGSHFIFSCSIPHVLLCFSLSRKLLISRQKVSCQEVLDRTGPTAGLWEGGRPLSPTQYLFMHHYPLFAGLPPIFHFTCWCSQANLN